MGNEDLNKIDNLSDKDLKEIFDGNPDKYQERAEKILKKIGLTSPKEINNINVPKPIPNQMSFKETRNYMDSILIKTTRGVQEMLRDIRYDAESDVIFFTRKVNDMKKAFENHIRNIRKESTDVTDVIDECTAQINRLENMLQEYTEKHSEFLAPKEKTDILRRFQVIEQPKKRNPLYPPAPTFDDLDSLIDVQHQDAHDLNVAKARAKEQNITLIPRATIPNSSASPGTLKKQLHMVRVKCVLEYLRELEMLKEKNEKWQVVDVDKLCESLVIDDPEKQEVMEEARLMLRNSNQWTGPQKRKFLIGLHHMLTKEFDNPGRFDDSVLDAYDHLIEPAPLSRKL